MKASISIVVSATDNGSEHALTWDMCREMTDSGLVEIDSHTYDLHNPDSCGAYKNEGDNGDPASPLGRNYAAITVVS